MSQTQEEMFAKTEVHEAPKIGIVFDALIPVRDKETLGKALEYWHSVEEIEIKSQEHFDNAAKVCIELAAYRKGLEKRRKELKSPHDEKGTYIQTEYMAVMSPLSNGEKKLKHAMGTYQMEAKRKADAENAKKAAEAEEVRRKAEERAAEEQKKADAYREQGREEMAEKAEVRAEAQVEKSVSVVAETVELKTTGKGITFSEYWEAELIDKKAFLRYCLDTNPLYLQQVTVNVKPYEAMQKKFNGELKIPGVRFNKVSRVAARTAGRVL